MTDEEWCVPLAQDDVWKNVGDGGAETGSDMVDTRLPDEAVCLGGQAMAGGVAPSSNMPNLSARGYDTPTTTPMAVDVTVPGADDLSDVVAAGGGDLGGGATLGQLLQDAVAYEGKGDEVRAERTAERMAQGYEFAEVLEDKDGMYD